MVKKKLATGHHAKKQFLLRLLLAAAALGAEENQAVAQVPANAFGQIMGTMVALGQAAQAREQWARQNPTDTRCIDYVLQRTGSSLPAVVNSGVSPYDPRLSRAWNICRISARQLRQNFSCPINIGGVIYQSYCNEEWTTGHNQKLDARQVVDAAISGQNTSVLGFERADASARRQEMQARGVQSTQVSTPSFDCSKAKLFFEQSICRSYDLSLIDAAYASLYRETRPYDQSLQAKKIAIHVQSQMSLCNTIECIKTNFSQGYNQLSDYVRSNGGTAENYDKVVFKLTSNSSSKNNNASTLMKVVSDSGDDECRWSRSARTNQSIRCPNDSASTSEYIRAALSDRGPAVQASTSLGTQHPHPNQVLSNATSTAGNIYPRDGEIWTHVASTEELDNLPVATGGNMHPNGAWQLRRRDKVLNDPVSKGCNSFDSYAEYRDGKERSCYRWGQCGEYKESLRTYKTLPDGRLVEYSRDGTKDQYYLTKIDDSYYRWSAYAYDIEALRKQYFDNMPADVADPNFRGMVNARSNFRDLDEVKCNF